MWKHLWATGRKTVHPLSGADLRSRTGSADTALQTLSSPRAPNRLWILLESSISRQRCADENDSSPLGADRSARRVSGRSGPVGIAPRNGDSGSKGVEMESVMAHPVFSHRYACIEHGWESMQWDLGDSLSSLKLDTLRLAPHISPRAPGRRLARVP